MNTDKDRFFVFKPYPCKSVRFASVNHYLKCNIVKV